jgi:hypothetical protein
MGYRHNPHAIAGHAPQGASAAVSTHMDAHTRAPVVCTGPPRPGGAGGAAPRRTAAPHKGRGAAHAAATAWARGRSAPAPACRRPGFSCMCQGSSTRCSLPFLQKKPRLLPPQQLFATRPRAAAPAVRPPPPGPARRRRARQHRLAPVNAASRGAPSVRQAPSRRGPSGAPAALALRRVVGVRAGRGGLRERACLSDLASDLRK